MKILSDREHSFLLSQIEFWQGRADAERERADRAVDTLMSVAGQLPISDLGLTAHKEKVERVENVLAEERKTLSEIYAEQIGELEDEVIA